MRLSDRKVEGRHATVLASVAKESEWEPMVGFVHSSNSGRDMQSFSSSQNTEPHMCILPRPSLVLPSSFPRPHRVRTGAFVFNRIAFGVRRFSGESMLELADADREHPVAAPPLQLPIRISQRSIHAPPQQSIELPEELPLVLQRHR